ncbi:major facilitator superfamily domain-containing protein [Aspergillus cavernicola]|uniref:Major facilitator superfamily domain-containing protein n=1 Tax=Aspergillus cavernicola TaxID=176166 RepID=A0ABR4IUP7_9EURO
MTNTSSYSKLQIVFRALQGIGWAGNYALCVAITLELVPPGKYAKYASLMSIIYAFSLLLGPVIGGTISENSTWRWIFLLNVPPAALAGVVLVVALPNGFPYHNEQRGEVLSLRESLRQTVREADFLGSSMLLVATTLFVTALEEANQEFQWRSAFTIVLFIISGLTWILFLAWERRVTLYSKYVEPVFPWSSNAICLGALSPLQAAVRFIPFTLIVPFGSMIAPAIGKILKVPLLYLVLLASVIQVISYVLLGTLSVSLSISASQYGYQILAGFGCGINITLLILIVPFTVEQRDNAVAMGAVAQFRVMGGCSGIAIVTAVANGYLQSHLSQFLVLDEVDAILQSAEMLSTLSSAEQRLARGVFSASYNLRMKILAGFAGREVLASLLMWQKSQLKV